MKPWDAFKIIGIASASMVFVSAAAFAWMLSKPLVYKCDAGRATSPQEIHAIKVVVRPWYGRHQVFGIFMVPLHYRSGRTYTGTISVKSFHDEFVPDWHLIQRDEDVVAEPGYYLVQGHIPTRVALLFLVTGQFGDLLNPCNWTLEFVKRAPVNVSRP